MKRFVIMALIIFISNLSYTQEFNTGLKLASPEELAGIPLASTPYSGETLPPSIDLSNKMPPVGNQGKQNSCVAWAVSYALKSYQEKIEENNPYTLNNNLNKDAIFSPAFVYNQINNGVDGGALFQDALNIISQQGAVKLSHMSYNERDYTTQPNENQKQIAKKYKIDFWRQVNIKDIKEVKAQINAGYPVLIGARIDEGFINNGKNNHSNYTWSTRIGNLLGGHAMVVVGYNDQFNAFKIMNSWGNEWGNNGYCWISYSLFPQVINEGYIAKDAINASRDIPTKPDNPNLELNISLIILNLQHNIPNFTFGPGMNFTGTVQIPSGIGKSYQIVIRFYTNNGNNGKGFLIGSTCYQFSLPDGSAATGTPLLPIQLQGGTFSWNAGMPYNCLRVLRGSYNIWGQYIPYNNYLIAEPLLYIDNYAVKIGNLVPFVLLQ